MPIAYNPDRPLTSLLGTSIFRALCHPYYVFSLLSFLVIRVAVAVGMSQEGAKQIDTTLTYPATVVGTLFSFLIGFFVNNCFTRFMDNWRAAMVGWSRINDLALQVHAYVRDRNQACEVMRLMNAANHLCYGDLAGQDMMSACIRRHLLAHEEVELLRKPGGPPPFYKAACWALQKLADQAVPQPVDKMFVLAMDKSIVEWRQQTTLLPMIQMNPIPLPYYRNIVILLATFQLVVAFKISLQGSTDPLDTWTKLQEVCIDFTLFASISLLCQSLFLTSVWLLMPWHADDSKGTTVDLPAEYFLMLPPVGHRRLFSDFQPDGSMFLRPLAKEDERLMQHFPTTDAGKMMAILHRSFRDLAPLSFQVRPSSQRFEPLATTPEVPGQDYRLFEERA